MHPNHTPIPRILPLVVMGCLFAGSVAAGPPEGGPIADLNDRVDELTQRVEVVETDVSDIDERLSDVVEVVDVTEALEMCVRVVEGELGGMPGPHWIFSGCNVHVRAKNLATDAPTNGRGNLVLGYNEGRCVTKEPFSGHFPDDELTFPKACLTDAECGDGAVCDLSGRGGSHNLIVGQQHRFPSFGGILGGRMNETTGRASSAAAGARNLAAGPYSGISGGAHNVAGGQGASVAGGTLNEADGRFATTAGGSLNRATGHSAHTSGGLNNVAEGTQSVVVGGGWTGAFNVGEGDDRVRQECPNIASGLRSVVVGGCGNDASGQMSSIVGGIGNETDGTMSVISGGAINYTGLQAPASVVSGGRNRIVEETFDWRAGGKFEDD